MSLFLCVVVLLMCAKSVPRRGFAATQSAARISIDFVQLLSVCWVSVEWSVVGDHCPPSIFYELGAHTQSLSVGWRPTHPLVDASTPWVQKLRAIGGDVLVPNMLSLLYKIRQAPMFCLCRQPQLGPTMVDFTHRLEAALVGHGLQRPYACMHWRVEDMLCSREPCPLGDFAFSDPSLAADLVTEALARHRPRVRSLLVLTQPSNLMLGAFAEALANRSELEDGTRGRGRRPFVVIAPARVYAADAQAYPEHVVSFEATFAEKALCAQAAYFFGDQRSSFSAHISAMGRAAAEDAGGAPWLERLAKSGQCYMHDVWDGVGKYCYA